MMQSMEVSYLLDGYAKSRGLTGWYRDLTVGEAKRTPQRGTLHAIDKHGCVREIRVTSVQTWKRSPGCVVKASYGRYEHFSVTNREGRDSDPITGHYGQIRIVVPVQEKFDKDTPPEIVSDWVKEHEIP
jgi:hypothetical protein